MGQFSQRAGKKQARVLSPGLRSARPDSREPALSETEGRLSLRGHRSSHDLRKFPYILFRGVERAHPAHDGLLFYPHVEEVTLFDPGDSVDWDLCENAVGFNFPDDLYPGNAADF